MARYKVEVDKEACIGCGMCASVDEKNFVMNDDGKSEPVNGVIGEEDVEKCMEAAESCPVNAIHITNQETKEKKI